MNRAIAASVIDAIASLHAKHDGACISAEETRLHDELLSYCDSLATGFDSYESSSYQQMGADYSRWDANKTAGYGTLAPSTHADSAAPQSIPVRYTINKQRAEEKKLKTLNSWKAEARAIEYTISGHTINAWQLLRVLAEQLPDRVSWCASEIEEVIGTAIVDALQTQAQCETFSTFITEAINFWVTKAVLDASEECTAVAHSWKYILTKYC